MVARNSTVRTKDRAHFAKLRLPCWLCGQPIDYALAYPHPGSYVLDHKVPLAKGGPDTRANKAPAHRQCNSAKAARLDGGPVLKRSGSYVLPD